MSTKLQQKVNAALASQWARPVRERVHIDLPLPISTNALWRPVNGGMVKTDRYRSWHRTAGDQLANQRPGRVAGPYTLTLLVNRRRSKMDLDNAIKATSDLLQHHGVIDNDRKAEEIHAKWSDLVTGMRVTVERWTEEAA